MKEKNNLKLFYIQPYEKNYNSGYHYKNDDTGCMDYMPASETIWEHNAKIFDSKEQLLKWFYKNADYPIPTVYIMQYVGNYKGLNDVIKITNLSDDTVGYYTALNKEMYAWYDAKESKYFEKNLWKSGYTFNGKFSFEFIYNEFIKRGIKIECNVFENNIDKRKNFEFIGDPFYRTDRETMKEKKLILYRCHPNNHW